MADSKNAGDNITEETSMDGMILVRHRQEIKQLESKEVEMKNSAPEGSKAEQKGKTKQVGEELPKLSANVTVKRLKELASQVYDNSSSSKRIKDEAKEKNPSSDGEWTEGREAERKGEPWVSDDLETDPQRQARLKEQIEISMKKMESSEFYKAFLKQLKSPEVSGHFRRVLGAETQLQMVIYGIGSIEKESPRSQLCIAILMKQEFDWVGDNIEVFDPVLSATESSVLKSLGFTVLSVNEDARREALNPTLFFMPHCPIYLYKNLLEANWRMDRLSKIALLGNSFQINEKKVSNDIYCISQGAKRIKAAGSITTEFAIEIHDHYYFPFSCLSWHFFSSAVDSELPLLVSEGS